MKPDIALIVDTLTPTDHARHTYQARWNLNTVQTVEDPATFAVTTHDAKLRNVAVMPLQTRGRQIGTYRNHPPNHRDSVKRGLSVVAPPRVSPSRLSRVDTLLPHFCSVVFSL